MTYLEAHRNRHRAAGRPRFVIEDLPVILRGGHEEPGYALPPAPSPARFRRA